MALEDIKENLREQFGNIVNQIKESSAFIEMSEKFQDLSPNAQKASMIGAATISTLILIFIPWMFFSGSQDIVAEFEDKRQVIRELFRVSREANSLPPEPPEITAMDLTSRIRNQLTNAKLQPDQIGIVTEISGSPIPGAPKAIKQAGAQVNLNKLNLTQVVDIGHQLQILHPTAKMVGMEVRANRDDNHYFDVVYKIVAFSLERPPEPKKSTSKRGSKKSIEDEG